MLKLKPLGRRPNLGGGNARHAPLASWSSAQTTVAFVLVA